MQSEPIPLKKGVSVYPLTYRINLSTICSCCTILETLLKHHHIPVKPLRIRLKPCLTTVYVKIPVEISWKPVYIPFRHLVKNPTENMVIAVLKPASKGIRLKVPPQTQRGGCTWERCWRFRVWVVYMGFRVWGLGFAGSGFRVSG